VKLAQQARSSAWVAAHCLLELFDRTDAPDSEDKRMVGSILVAQHFRAVETLLKGLSS
jgi:hypothetical protein